jgi:nucleotide-binding universal stress UspA family protein
MSIENILVPVDLEDETTFRKPLEMAVEYAGWSGAKVHVITVIPTDMLRMSIVAQAISEDFEEKLREQAKTNLAAAVKKSVPDGFETTQIVHLGKIPHEILETARDIEADLIVMAAHKPSLGDFMTGSTTSQVVQRAPCSVWIVRG